MHWCVAALIAVIFAYVVAGSRTVGLCIRVTGEAPRADTVFSGCEPTRMVCFAIGSRGCLAGSGSMFEGRRPRRKRIHHTDLQTFGYGCSPRSRSPFWGGWQYRWAILLAAWH